MSFPEDLMRALEDRIPSLAEPAFSLAYHQALAAGSTVLVQDGDALVEVSPDGTRRVLRRLPGPVPVPVLAPPDVAAE